MRMYLFWKRTSLGSILVSQDGMCDFVNSLCEKPFKCVVIQPGAESEEILRYLGENRLPYLEGCLLVGLSLYAGDGEAKGQA